MSEMSFWDTDTVADHFNHKVVRLDNYTIVTTIEWAAEELAQQFSATESHVNSSRVE